MGQIPYAKTVHTVGILPVKHFLAHSIWNKWSKLHHILTWLEYIRTVWDIYCSTLTLTAWTAVKAKQTSGIWGGWQRNLSCTHGVRKEVFFVSNQENRLPIEIMEYMEKTHSQMPTASVKNDSGRAWACLEVKMAKWKMFFLCVCGCSCSFFQSHCLWHKENC